MRSYGSTDMVAMTTLVAIMRVSSGVRFLLYERLRRFSGEGRGG